MRRLLFLIALLLPLAASAQSISGGSAPVQRLCFGGTSAGIVGVTSQWDTLQTCTIPAGILANVGDTLHVVASGTFIGGTDSKNVQIQIAAVPVATVNGATAGANRWYAEAWLTKTGASTQAFMALGANATSTVGTDAGTKAITDTLAITVLVRAQNTTNAVAASVTCQAMTVDFIRGS